MDVPNDVIDEVIDEGVIEIRDWNESIKGDLNRCVNNVIENGIKKTKVCNYVDPETQIMSVKWGNQIDEVIENGVKETEPMDDWVNTNRIVTEVMDNGVKETKFANRYDYIGPIFKEGKIQEVLEKGIKNPTD